MNRSGRHLCSSICFNDLKFGIVPTGRAISSAVSSEGGLEYRPPTPSSILQFPMKYLHCKGKSGTDNRPTRSRRPARAAPGKWKRKKKPPAKTSDVSSAAAGRSIVGPTKMIGIPFESFPTYCKWATPDLSASRYTSPGLATVLAIIVCSRTAQAAPIHDLVAACKPGC